MPKPRQPEHLSHEACVALMRHFVRLYADALVESQSWAAVCQADTTEILKRRRQDWIDVNWPLVHAEALVTLKKLLDPVIPTAVEEVLRPFPDKSHT